GRLLEDDRLESGAAVDVSAGDFRVYNHVSLLRWGGVRQTCRVLPREGDAPAAWSTWNMRGHSDRPEK
ncbi:MAG: hypothetical protein RBT16_09865, partial [Desulfococcus multivorans]|nr:hypothetical protein [Desulfococcus multivorans]